MQTKEECFAALDKLEGEIKTWMDALKGDPSPQGHDREMDIAIQRLEESAMWMRRAMERKFT
ncbi:hypothetical protein GWE18_00310 [Bradyrhizobium sp. CSA112]|uniref:hypothetical protein n=1 Tax=Bradyrhizobium sp. CSA112 TaxID=2699170 RepID=UPI0023AF0AC5|nr:hypothetical protein [Bradyrhizobium sp. CSA112]MDE5451319.1 hypothetical protein [Bradyrhizobium sp. CSA112]